jgi:hypothetical protein
MTNKDEYLLNGFTKNTFKKTECFDEMVRSLQVLNDSDELSGKFFWESKYKDTLDLRPNVYDFSESFIEILIENKILESLRTFTQLDLVLSHIQIRKSFAMNSYMDWHRDSYYINNEAVGNNPSVHKLIFYPSFESESRPKLKILAGSHACAWNFQQDRDMLAPGLSHFDAQISQFFPEVRYDSSVSEFILFDTSLLHGVIPDDENSHSVRVIYSFVTRDQFIEKYSQKSHHLELEEKFEKMRKLNER